MRNYEALLKELPVSQTISTAADLASRHHSHQYRKISKEPYILHPIRMAINLYTHGANDVVIACALLHDVLEDGPNEFTTRRRIYKSLSTQLSPEIAKIVWSLSDDKSITDRSRRKKDAYTRLQKAPKEALFVKAADIIDNTNDLVQIVTIGGCIPWEIFHFPSHIKLQRWQEQLDLITYHLPGCSLLEPLRRNLSIIEQSLDDFNQT